MIIDKLISFIKRIFSGNEHDKCSSCGEDTSENSGLYQKSGNTYNSTEDEDEVDLEDGEDDGTTVCFVVDAKSSGIFTFAKLKIDITPKSLLKLPMYQDNRWMAEPDHYEFYVFKTNKYSDLSKDSLLYLNFDNYDNFKTSNGYTIYFDKTHFSQIDIKELKTYTFNQ